EVVQAHQTLMEDRQLQFTVSLPAAPLWLEADPTRLEQILANLLNNAAKYTPSGGRVWLSANAEDGQVVIPVRGRGWGIAGASLPFICDLFVQGQASLDRPHGGLGIGLTLVKTLVEMHGGTVTATSSGPGRGSEFIVRLPLLGQAPVSPTSDEP